MIPGQYAITLYQGDDFYLPLRLFTSVWVPPATVEDELVPGHWIKGDPLDLTGATIEAQVREWVSPSKETGDLLGSFDIAVPPQADDDLGRLLVHLPAARASDLPVTTPAKLHAWDLQVQTLVQGTQTYLAGGVRVLPEVTKA